MAGKSRQVTIQFLGDANSFISATGKATRASDTFSGKLRKVGKAALIGFAGATIAAGKVAYEFAEAAVEDEKSASLLAQTLKNVTKATDDQVQSAEDWISMLGRTVGITDDELRPALSRAVTSTHDLGKAQDLVSLAMDISTAKQKSLSSVTEALGKAQNGNLVGLSKMGVAVKDADGKTRSLEAITADLAKTYGGAAAKAADTAAGKFQRVKTALSETAESIGYDLLPYATDLGDWLVRVGVPALQDGASAARRELTPALQDLSGFVKENKDEFKDLGHEVLETVIPAIKTVGGLAGDAVGFFSRLPGPIKEVGVEAGIAAVIIPRLSSAIGGVTTAAGLSTTKLTGWRKGLLLTAGITGIGAVVEGAKTGNKAVSLFGDAMTGAFVGGTLGSAIPGVGTAIGAVGGAAVGTAVGLFKMHRGADAAGESSKDASPKIENLAGSLDQVTGAATRATKAMILQKLQEDGVTTAAGQLGIANSDLIKSVLGNHKAIERVNSAWEKNGNLLDGLSNSDISSFLAGLRQDLGKAEKSVKDNNAALDGTDRKATKAGKALGGVGKQRPQTDKWSALYTGDLNKAVHNTGTMSEGMRRLLAGTPGKARANMGPFGTDLAHQLAGIKGRANTAGIGIGNSIESGVSSGLSGIISNTVNTIQAAINAAHTAAAGGGGGGGGGGGKHKKTAAGSSGKVVNLADFAGGFNPRKMEVAGNNLIESITRGLKKGERTLKNVLSGIHDYIKNKTDALQSILDERAGFVDQFRDAFSESIFSSQFADAEGNTLPPTIQKMMEFAKQQQANAHQLAANIKALINKGLSKDLLTQLVNQGQSGFDQIAALAGGSQADIAAFNQINSDIKSTLEGLGTDIWGALNPEKNGQIKVLTDQLASANRQEALLQRIADQHMEGEVKIKGTDLVITIRKVEKETGKKLFVSSA